MKTRSILASMVLLIVTLTTGVFAATPATQPGERRNSDILSRRISDIDVKDVPLHGMLELLCGHAQINLVMATDRTPGVNETLNLKNVTIQNALDAVFTGKDLGYELQDNNLIVFSLSYPPASMVQLEIYGVGDLVDYTAEHEMSSLIETIKATIAPESWRENGGGGGSIRAVNGSLVIKQLPRNHREISLLLGKLRDHKGDLSISTHAQASQMEAKVQIVGNLKETCSDPKAMGIIAISELRALDKPEEVIKRLTARLDGETDPIRLTTPLRNAIRLTLKDIYLEKGDLENARKQLEAILNENNADIAASLSPGARGYGR